MRHPRYTIDFETFSECDLRKSGLWRYAEDPSTEVLCVAWKPEGGETLSQVFGYGVPLSPEFKTLIRDLHLGALINAHNSEFEAAILWSPAFRKLCGGITVRPSQFRCSMARALACGLPAGLDNLAKGLGLPIAKDSDGYKLMLKACKPDKNGKRHDSLLIRQRLELYCQQDVNVEAACEEKLPELSPTEQAVWELTLKTNRRGVPLDIISCRLAADAMREYSERLDKRCRKLTNGIGGRQVGAMLKELHDRGLPIESLNKESVAKALESHDLTPEVRELLELRQESGKSSTAKLDRMLQMVCEDGRIRGNLRYHGASTGRWSGQGVQFQNLFRPTIKNVDLVFAALETDLLHELYSSPAEAVASSVRGMLCAEEGKVLVDGDFSAIEARVLAWLASDPGYEAFKKNLDTYKIMAGRIFNVSPDSVTGDQRTVGKTSELGCGYGMGHKKFLDTCIKYGIPMTLELAKTSVEVYRNAHQKIVQFWKDTEKAAVNATRNPHTVYPVGRVAWKRVGPWLMCRLPSGRLLRYYQPHVKSLETKWGTKDTLHYTCTDKGKAFVDASYGGLLVENVTQGTARDFMCESMIRLENAGFPVILTVHDEVLCEVSEPGDEAEFVHIMEQTPAWAPGFPLKVGSWKNRRFRK